MRKILFFGLITALLFSSRNVNAQTDTVSIMFYNLLNYPDGDAGTVGGAERVDTLEDIITYVQPDLFLVNELESLYGANLILSNAMNVNGVTHYARATFFNGADTDNLLYYNTEKFGLLEQHQIGTSIRDISEYLVYYKEPNMSAATDTTYLWLYSCHLKAGSGVTNEDQRESEAIAFKNYIQNQNRTGNLIIGGDFNFYSGSEPACQHILTGGTVPFNDPINSLGNWNNNSFYADIHTQSSRAVTNGFAGGSYGGLDDRFDIIFATDEVMDGTNGVQYLTNSYHAIGNDGNHFNGNINDFPNNDVPLNVANALFHNSDHLPIYMEMVIDFPVGVQEQQALISKYHFNSNTNQLKVMLNEFSGDTDYDLYNLSGQLVQTGVLDKASNNVQLPELSAGMYIFSVRNESGAASAKIVKE